MRKILLMLGMIFSASTVAADYALQSGDMLWIEVLEDESLNRNAPVLPDGTISFPLVGQTRVAGLSLARVSQQLARALAPNYVIAPTVHVSVEKLAAPKAAPAPVSVDAKTVDVFGIGELGKPGPVQVKDGATLLQFVAQAGGLTRFAARKRVQIRRTNTQTGKEQLFRVNLKKVMAGSGSSDFRLEDGDVVIVPERRLFE